MPAIANLSINDGQGTPASHTFAVGTTDGSSAKWLEKTAAASTGYYVLSYSIRMAKTPTAANVVEINLALPTLDGTSLNSVMRKSTASLRFNFAQAASQQEMKDMVAYVTNFLSNATVKSAIPALEPFY